VEAIGVEVDCAAGYSGEFEVLAVVELGGKVHLDVAIGLAISKVETEIS
jgi:hypothetical protein